LFFPNGEKTDDKGITRKSNRGLGGGIKPRLLLPEVGEKNSENPRAKEVNTLSELKRRRVEDAKPGQPSGKQGKKRNEIESENRPGPFSKSWKK